MDTGQTSFHLAESQPQMKVWSLPQILAPWKTLSGTHHAFQMHLTGQSLLQKGAGCLRCGIAGVGKKGGMNYSGRNILICFLSEGHYIERVLVEVWVAEQALF